MDKNEKYIAGLNFLKETSLAKSKTGKIAEPETAKICKPNLFIKHLPEPGGITLPKMDLRTAFDKRETVRDYSKEPISTESLSLILYYTQGIRKQNEQQSFRTVPSAGSRHAFETHLLLNRVKGIEPGLYRYLPTDHALVKEECGGGDLESIALSCNKPDMVKNSAVTFIWTAAPERMCCLFGERGWRYLFLDAGHVCQNLYLISEPLDCGVCAVGAFRDENINAAIGVDGEQEFVIYMATLGKK